MRLSEIVASARAALPNLVVAVDFDGTLAPLVDDPELSRPAEGALAALRALTERGALVAVITGREARTAVRLGGFGDVPGIVVEGLYGAETWADGALETLPEPAGLRVVREALPSLLVGADPAVWIEDKRLSLVIQARRASDPDRALAALRPGVAELAAANDLVVHSGHDVLEVRLPELDKAAALRRVARPGAVTIYIGDDLGDLPAFEEIARLRCDGERAYTVGVGSSGVHAVLAAADVVVPGPPDVVEFLAALA